MKLTPKFNKNDLRKFIEQRVRMLDEVILDQLKDVAEQFVADARQTNTYKDQTGNLRGSIGYTILRNGEEVFGSFEGTQTGQSEAMKRVQEVKDEKQKGYVLVVVAGMNYAAFVEAKGFDVITGTSQTAEVNLTRSINRIRQRLKKLK